MTTVARTVRVKMQATSSVSGFAGFWRRLAAHMIDWTLAVVVVGFVLLVATAFSKPPLESRTLGTYLGGIVSVVVDVEQKATMVNQAGETETHTREMVTTRVAGLPVYMNRHNVVYWGSSSMTLGYPSPMWVGLVTALMLISGAFFEASRLRATPGKLAMGLKVIGETGGPLSLSRSLVRQAAKLGSFAVFCIGFLMIGWTKRKQGLHDMAASALVVRT